MNFVSNIPGANLRVVCRSMRTIIIDGEKVMRPGFAAQFNNGIFSTDSLKEIKMLRESPAFGIDFHEVPGSDVVEEAAPKVKKLKKKKKRFLR